MKLARSTWGHFFGPAPIYKRITHPLTPFTKFITYITAQFLLVTLSCQQPESCVCQKLVASDGAASDFFGTSVYVSGDYALVGATGGKGSAYIFFRSISEEWNQQVKLNASDGAPNDAFGFSVSLSGDYALVGAANDDVGTNLDQGSAYVFLRSDTSWSQQAKLTATDGASNDWFGYSVSLSDDYALVGIIHDDIGSSVSQGSAYVFKRSDTIWNQQANLTALDGAANDQFGCSVSLSGEYALVGAYDDDVGANTDQGSAYIFLRASTSWNQQVQLTASDSSSSDGFGYSVSLSGNYAVIGAPYYSIGYANTSPGSAYLFHRNMTTWQEIMQLAAYDGSSYANFGSSVSMSGNNIVIGALSDYIDSNSEQGSAYYFFYNDSSTIIDFMKIVASDGASYDNFGFTVSASNDCLVIGSLKADISGNTDQGAAYITNISSVAFYECPVGAYAFGSLCPLCESGKYSSYTGQASCLDCPIGKYYPATGGSDCISCATGYFNDQVGQASCTICSRGTYNNETGSTSISSCLDCAAGKSNNEKGEAECEDCVTGKYASSTGNFVCTDCLQGRYTEQIGQTSCTNCTAGKYGTTTGSSSESDCASCDAGTYTTWSGQASCIDCDIGKYSLSSSTNCSNCSADYYQPSTGQASCSHCGFHTCTNGETGRSSCDFCTDLYNLTSVSGCVDDTVSGSTSDCPTIGGVAMTIVGEGWNLVNVTDAFCLIGGKDCRILSIISSTSFTCRLPPNVGLDVEIVITDFNGYSGRASKISYALAVATSVHGCDDTEDLPHPNGTSACYRDGTDDVTIIGINFGPDQANVLIGGVKAVIFPLADRGLSGWEQNTTIVQVPAGSGLGVGVNVLQKGGELGSGFRMLSYTGCLENYLDSLNVTSGIYACICPKTFYLFNDRCNECLGAMICDEEGSILTSMSLDGGHWRESSTGLLIRECPYENACTGSSDVSNQCADGHSGPLCAVCEDGYISGSRFENCTSCFEGSSSLSVLALGAVAFLGVILLFYVLYHKSNLILLFLRFINIPSVRVKMKIFLIYCQIISQFQFILSADYPSNYSSFLSILHIFNLNLSSILSLKCFNQQYTFHDEMMISTLLPFLICFFLVVGYSKSSFFSGDANSRQESRSGLIEWLLFVLYFFFSSASRAVFEMFNCDDDFESGSSYLRADYRLTCSGPNYQSYRSYAIIMIFIYPIGIPLLFFSVLFTHRKTIDMDVSNADKGLTGYLNNARDKEIAVAQRLAEVLADYRSMRQLVLQKKENIRVVRDCNHLIEDRLKMEYSRVLPDLVPYAFLYEAYRSSLWFFECVECMRRLSLTGLLVFMYPGTDKQILLAMILCMIWIILYSWTRPFLDPIHNFIIGSAKWGICLQLYGTLLLKQHQFVGRLSSIGGFMIAVGMVFPLMPLIIWKGWIDYLKNMLLRMKSDSKMDTEKKLKDYMKTQGAMIELQNPMNTKL